MLGQHQRPRLTLLIASSILLVTRAAIVSPNALQLRISKNISHEIPSTLYGYMWEELNQSGDGGLYGELLRNRAFQAVIPGTQQALIPWQAFNGARISVTAKVPGVSKSLPNSLEVKLPKGVSGPIGFENPGFWGIKVLKEWTYKGSFWAKSGTFNGVLTISLKSARGDVFATSSLAGVTNSWKKFSFTLVPTRSALNHDNVFSVSVDGKAAAGQVLHFGMFSLFPPTFRGRENGMRIDLADTLAATNPSIWRFPGGSNLEGHSFDQRWKWNETIGPLEERPGRVGEWTYSNTNGLGLMEYLDWAEDIDAEPILGVWDGIAIANFSDLSTWPTIPEDELQPYIQDVLNELEFIVGDPDTTEFGQLRARYGRREPYRLRYIEIGNEDQFQPESYATYRWKAFVSAIGERYPEMEFIATTFPSTALDPPYKKIDFHMYNSPPWFLDNAFMFDDYPRNGTQFFIGEYAVTSTNDHNALGDLQSGRLLYPTLEGAIAEAAFLTGTERNSDVVFAVAYAPSFQHINNYQWTPDIVTYDASRLVKSTSYYVQQMFSVNRGSHVLGTQPPSSQESVPLFWVASYQNQTDVIYLKMVNTGNSSLVANIVLDFTITGMISVTTLSTPPLTPIFGRFNISNTLEDPDLIVPAGSTFAIPNSDRFNYTFPAMSLTVIAMQSLGRWRSDGLDTFL